MKFLFIVNPKAGHGKAKGLVPLIQNICNKKGVEFKIEYTMAPEHATQIAKEGSKYFDVVASVGGDGTLNEVVNGIIGSEAALGVIPGGTGNDFARTIYEDSDIEKILEYIINGEIIRVDLGKCNDRFFINIGSAGIDSEIAHAVQRSNKIFSGKSAYLYGLVKTLLKYQGKNFNVSIDEYSFNAKTLLVTASNGKYYGGGMLPTPEADISDGLFDICFIENMNKLKIPFLLSKYIKGEHIDLREVSMFKGSKLVITSDEEFAVNIDGEIIITDRAEFEILKNALNVVIPRNS
ncbi:Diacylglycerol kinase [Caloramator mitchellensis]|uniref:Diacylglycerol kinase n=1 Tax=Caloramator mitchellensis TaxID=908809 RepID=A0A0R3JXK7_CALMK|nr:diacylglycerol kinase family protein [Caloramator mitchellensis]KRQ85934.1 Diacylglycerol kinase [Caloramator mitchellensis]